MKEFTPYSLSVSEVFDKLASGKNGLSSFEAEQRQIKHGFNELAEKKGKSPFIIFLNQFKSLLVFILLGVSAISFAIDHVVDAYVILAEVFINSIIGFVQEYRAENSIVALKKMLTQTVKVLRDNEKRTIQSRELVPGDIIFIEEGDNIPADARLIESKNLRTIEASLTGESVPSAKNTDILNEDIALADRANMLFKGTFAAGGTGLAIVTATGMQTAIGSIAQSLSSIKKIKTNFQQKTDKLATQMAWLSIFFAVLLFAIGYLYHNMELKDLLLTSIAALVSVIPEGLPAVLSITLAIGARRMSNKKPLSGNLRLRKLWVLLQQLLQIKQAL